MLKEEIDILALKLWNYLCLYQELEKSDVILVFGCSDIRVAERAADIFLEGYAPLIVFSGGLGKITEKTWNKPEAEKFAEVAINKGVPKDKILIENRSTNTGENIVFTDQIFLQNNLHPKKIITVQKPYSQRRNMLSLSKYWPDVQIILTAPILSYDTYPTEEISKDQFINLMVGDIQRLKVFAQKGYMTSTQIPDEIWGAYEELVEAGYNKQLLSQNWIKNANFPTFDNYKKSF